MEWSQVEEENNVEFAQLISSPKVIGYWILENYEKTQLEKDIVEATDNGWELYGDLKLTVNPVDNSLLYTQVLVNYEKETN